MLCLKMCASFKSLLPRLVHVISLLRPSDPEGSSVVDQNLSPSPDLLDRLKHHVDLSRAIHANEESHKELSLPLPLASLHMAAEFTRGLPV